MYSQVIDILKELSVSGNVQFSLQKIDMLINGLQHEMDEDEEQPSIPLNFNTQTNNNNF